MNTFAIEKTASDAHKCKTSSKNIGITSSNDDFVRNKDKAQSPLINRIYYTRNLLMQKIFSASISTVLDREKEKMQILILGAGLDYSFSTDEATTFAIDFDDILKQRAELYASKDYDNLIGADLSDVSGLFYKLSKSGFIENKPTIIILECVLCYLHLDDSKLLLSHLSLKLPHAIMIVYNPLVATVSNIDINDGYSTMLSGKFRSANVPILSSFSSLREYATFLRECNWKHINCLTITNAVQTILTASERNLRLDLEPFDEFASLALLNSLYSIAIASTDVNYFQLLTDQLFTQQQQQRQQQQQQLVKVNTIEQLIINTENPEASGPMSSALLSQLHTSSKRQFYDQLQSLQHRLHILTIRLDSLDVYLQKNQQSSLTQQSLESYQNILSPSYVTSSSSSSTSTTNSTSTTSCILQNGYIVKIRKASQNDLKSVTNLIEMSYKDVSKKYKAVRTHLKKQLAELQRSLQQQHERTVSGPAGRLEMFVVCHTPSYSSSTEHLSEDVIVGCGGYRIEDDEPSSSSSSPSSPVLQSLVMDPVNSNPPSTTSSSTTTDGCIISSCSHSCRLLHMCVDSNYQRLGIGTLILTKLLSEIKLNRYHKIILSTLQDFSPARLFYKKHGFQEIVNNIKGNEKDSLISDSQKYNSQIHKITKCSVIDMELELN